MSRLLVVAGHGAGDPGACAHGYTEAERVRVLADRIKAIGGDSVIVGDTSKNWYASNLFNSVDKSTFDFAIELHMDSASPSARGGHVIIKQGFVPDSYDSALAGFISGYFPGRSVSVSQRSDLQNMNVCAQRGINYRLLETCFISNAGDIAKFNADVDSVARGILKSLGIVLEEKISHDLQMYEPNCTDAQLFRVLHNEDGTKTFICVANELAIDVQGAQSEPNAFLWLYKQNGTDAQKFWLERAVVDYNPKDNMPYIIVPAVNKDLAVDCYGGGIGNGTKLWTYKKNGTQAQMFYLLDRGNGTFCIVNPISMKAIDAVGGGKI